MLKPPRKMSTSFFSFHELTLSIFQGLAITLECLGLGYFFMLKNHSEAEVRTIIYATLIFSNIFLTLVNRSFYYSVITTINYPNKLVLYIIAATVIITGLLIFIKPISSFFELQPLSMSELLISTGVGFISVIWFELIKWNTRRQST